MKYVVNKIIDPEVTSDWKFRRDVECYGLFTEPAGTDGEGHFCGWYAKEYYIDTDLIAVAYVFNADTDEPKFSGWELDTPKHFDSIQIFSVYTGRYIETEDKDVAIEQFADKLKERGYSFIHINQQQEA